MDSYETEPVQNETDIKDVLESLRHENEMLKAQFDEAVLSAQKTKDAQKTVDKLHAQIAHEKSEYKELKHVLELTERNAKEAEIKLQKQKKIAEEERIALINQNNEKIKTIEIQYKKDNEEVFEQVKKLLDEREDSIIKSKTLDARLERTFQTASRYFNSDINSLEALRDALKSQPISRETVKYVEVEASNNDKCNIYKRKVQKLVKKNEILKEALKTIKENELEELNRIKHENKEYVIKIAALEEQKEFKEQQNQEKVQSLEKRLSASNEELAKCRAQLNDLTIQSQQIEMQPIQEEIKEPFEEKKEEKRVTFVDERSTDDIENCINDLKQQIIDTEDRNRMLVDKFTELQEQFKEQQTILTNEQISYQSLISVHKETVNELETVRQALIDRQRPLEEAQISLNDYKKREEQLKKNLADAKKKISELNATIANLHREDVRKQDAVDDMRRELSEVKDANKQLEKANSILREESTALHFKIDNTKQPTANDLLPPNVWIMSDASETLAKQISSIASNSSLQPISKLQNIYSAIKKHYNSIINKLGDEIEKCNDVNTVITEKVNDFFVNASIILNEEAFTIEEFLNGNRGERFILQLTQLKNSTESLRNENESLTRFADEFETQLGKSDDKVAHVKEVKDLLDYTHKECEKREYQCRKLKRALREHTKIVEEKLHNMKKANEELTNENESLNSRLNQIQSTLTSVKNENIKMHKKLNEEKEIRQKVEGEIHDQTQKYIDELNMTRVFEQQQKENDIKKRENSINERNNRIADLTKQLEKAKLHIRILTEKNEDLQNELSETRECNNASQKEIIEKYEVEKKHMRDTFNDSLEELRKQCDKHRSDIVNLSEQLNKEETSNGMLKATIAECKKEKSRMSRNLVIEKEQLERKRKLIEAECRMKVSAAESNYERKLDEERAKNDQEMKEIYNFIVKEFEQFYQPIDRLNEATFRSVIHSVHEAFESLSASNTSIRNMLSATDGQTTEDAVAQSLIK